MRYTRLMKFIRIFLLALIIIGIGLLLTQKKWVPGLTDYILKHEKTHNNDGISLLNVYTVNGSNIYYYGTLVNGADVGTFKFIGSNGTDSYGKDNLHVYKGASIIPGADPKTFTWSRN